MSDHTLKAIDEAIRAHIADEIAGEDDASDARRDAVVINWVTCYTLSGVVQTDGLSVVGYTNDYIATPGDPNAAVNLARWVADEIDSLISHWNAGD